jgi:protein-serine/threonine kinase
MDWYMHKSLDLYIKNNFRSTSLLTKLYLLCQVVQGLRFLRDNNIVHMDIKPQNVLVGKGLLLRLTDFG